MAEESLNMPDDDTCFIKMDIRVPLHWVSTRWLIDIEGKNVFKCLSEPDGPKKPMAEPKKRKGEFKNRYKIIILNRSY